MPNTVVSPFSTPADVAAALARPLPVECRLTVELEELALHFRIREEVFVHEQGFFLETDRDVRDDDPSTLHVLGLWGSVAGGTVRLYPLEEQVIWKGDRLAVLPAFRKHGLGAPLVRFAVREAARRGGILMVAYIQPSNVAFFEHLGWYRVGAPLDYVGHPHQRMAIDLRGQASDPSSIPRPEPGDARPG